uniref:Retrovirus-related Pol polyprotein from transposon TNT 1-94 n=1 Tax=Tanacetum cinerariifolium TaxID=118510 RepID=A0A699JI16_TANCI|nr:retrovirus-related Pol polyprotein from transposon TNT 1-94 [Tanacetum cinerariifolium]
MGLWYSKDTDMFLTTYADADHVGCQDTRLLGDKLVSWSSKKQKSTAISSTNAKYIALSREQLGDASIDIQAYTLALKKVEAQLVYHQKNQLAYEEKIRFIKIDLDDKTNVLIYHKKLLAEAVKENKELKTKLESFKTSSKSLNTMLNSQLSPNDKVGFRHNGAKESKVSETITSVSKVKTSNSVTSNDKVKMPKIKIVRMSKPIIEEWESDSEDDEIVVKPKEVTKIVKPSFEKIKSVNARNKTVRQAKNPRKNNKSPRGNKRNWNGMMTQKLGENFKVNNKACYLVCIKFMIFVDDHGELDVKLLIDVCGFKKERAITKDRINSMSLEAA